MKTRDYKPITNAQIQKLNVLLNQKGIADQKRALIYSFSDGRTTSTKELAGHEAKQLIMHLVESDADREAKAKQELKAIFMIATKMDMIYGNTEEDHLMNVAKLNKFCRERGSVKKNLSAMTLGELRKTHKQFEAMYKSYKNKKKN